MREVRFGRERVLLTPPADFTTCALDHAVALLHPDRPRYLLLGRYSASEEPPRILCWLGEPNGGTKRTLPTWIVPGFENEWILRGAWREVYSEGA